MHDCNVSEIKFPFRFYSDIQAKLREGSHVTQHACQNLPSSGTL